MESLLRNLSQTLQKKAFELQSSSSNRKSTMLCKETCTTGFLKTMFAYITRIGQRADIIKTIFLLWFCYVVLLQLIIFRVTERARANHDSKRQSPIVFSKIACRVQKYIPFVFVSFFCTISFLWIYIRTLSLKTDFNWFLLIYLTP